MSSPAGAEDLNPWHISAQQFDRWWKRTKLDRPDLLALGWEDVVDPSAPPVRPDDFPDRWGALVGGTG